MSKFFLFISFLFYSLVSYAQSTSLEYTINFQATERDDGTYLSQKVPIKKVLSTPFISVSGYFPQSIFTGILSYRAQKKEQWSTWQTFSQFKEGIVTNRVAFNNAIVDNSIDYIQFKSTAKSDKPFICRLFYPGHSEATYLPAIDRNSAITCEQPNFCGRACWCPTNNCPPDATPVTTEVTHIIVHHSAGQTTSNDFKAVVRSYWDGHVNTRGWDDIGYNWLIDANGVIYEGRGEGRLGAHFSCMNERTVGICIIGNYETVRPSDAALQSLKKMIAWEASKGKINVEAIGYHESAQIDLQLISGHRDGQISQLACSSTVCPGDSLYAELPLLRAEIAALPCMIEEDSVEMITAVEDLSRSNNLRIQPNPNKGQFSVNLSVAKSETAQFFLQDVLGATHFLGKESLIIGENYFSFDIVNYRVGVYWLTVQVEEGLIQRKILKVE